MGSPVSTREQHQLDLSPEIHRASFVSLLRPGTFRMCMAFANTSVKCSSSTCHTGFQYTPVAFIATCVQPWPTSHASSASSPAGRRRRSVLRWTGYACPKRHGLCANRRKRDDRGPSRELQLGLSRCWLGRAWRFGTGISRRRRLVYRGSLRS